MPRRRKPRKSRAPRPPVDSRTRPKVTVLDARDSSCGSDRISEAFSKLPQSLQDICLSWHSNNEQWENARTKPAKLLHFFQNELHDIKQIAKSYPRVGSISNPMIGWENDTLQRVTSFGFGYSSETFSQLTQCLKDMCLSIHSTNEDQWKNFKTKPVGLQKLHFFLEQLQEIENTGNNYPAIRNRRDSRDIPYHINKYFQAYYLCMKEYETALSFVNNLPRLVPSQSRVMIPSRIASCPEQSFGVAHAQSAPIPDPRSHVSRRIYPNIREDFRVEPGQSRYIQPSRVASVPEQDSYRASIQRTTNPKDKSFFAKKTNRKEQRSGFDSKVREISDKIQSISLNDQLSANSLAPRNCLYPSKPKINLLPTKITEEDSFDQNHIQPDLDLSDVLQRLNYL